MVIKRKKLTGVIHAGWKGVYNGILENFISKAAELNFKKSDLIFALGPCIGKNSYEVDKIFRDSFLEKTPETECFFEAKKIKITLILTSEGV